MRNVYYNSNIKSMENQSQLTNMDHYDYYNILSIIYFKISL